VDLWGTSGASFDAMPRVKAASLLVYIFLVAADGLELLRHGIGLNTGLGQADEGVFAPPPDKLCLRNNTGVPCVNPLDPKQCTPGASKFPAITMTFDMNIPWKYNKTLYRPLRSMADLMGADLVMLLPSRTAFQERVEIPIDTLEEIRQYFRVVRVPWVTPPRLSKRVPLEGGCCGAREFMKLHAIGLEDYDAVVNLDTDFSVHGSLRPLFDCAASGRFLTARGSISGVNGGMFVVRPSKGLLQDLIAELRVSSASETEGWNGRGLAPGARWGQAGLQGFLYYYFYQRGPSRKGALPGQVDPCLWTGAIFCKLSTCGVAPLRHKIRCPPGTGPADSLELPDSR